MTPIGHRLGPIAVCALACAACLGSPAAGAAGSSDTAPVQDGFDATAAGPSVGLDATVDCSSAETCDACQHGGNCPQVGSRCVAGACLPPVQCQNSKHCDGIGAICDLFGGFCVDCLTAANCPKPSTCKAHQCVSVSKSCKSAKDCGGSTPKCDTATKICVECLQSADCTASQHCEDGLCMPGALKLCTPGANVFCDCLDGKQSGTKLCLADGLHFGPCEPCEPDG